MVPWYQYAARFVETIKTKSPKVVVRQVSAEASAKISAVLMLSGLIEVTVKTKGDVVIVVTNAPKYETYSLE